MDKQHTVVAILEAKPEKVSEFEAALMEVAMQSRLEKSNIEFRLHKSIDHPNQFILYENWVSQDKHQEQFEKPYIKSFASQLESFLAKPYDVYALYEIVN